MASVETLLSESDIQKKRRRQLIISIIIGVVVLHVGAGVVAGIFVVAKYIFPPPANFVVKKDVRLPAKKREHKMNMASLDAAAPKPTFSDRMQSTRPTAFSLPEMPQIPLDQAVPLDPSQLVADNVSSLAAADGIGTGGVGSAGSAGFGGKGISFLGVESTGQRILLMIDISGTVMNKAAKAGVPPEKLREELVNLIKNLPITSRFSIIQYAGNYKPFNTELVPASQPNKTLATEWIQNEWVTGGIQVSKKTVASPSGFVGVLGAAAAMKPDAVFIITDGSYKSKVYPKGIPWEDIRKAAAQVVDADGKPAKINVIAFEAGDEDLKELRRMANTSKGNIREMK
jgi:hypothetical protein